MVLSRTRRSLEGTEFEIWTQKMQFDHFSSFYINLNNEKWGVMAILSGWVQWVVYICFLRWPYHICRELKCELIQ